ncbi:MAG TPA: O-antigen ligase family protein [Solirubrobacteraceae bacterium]|jgi:O-antigen ligase|nr:O-antigen ligase family protein [Solirubrobacteraceae bacterium]
MTAKLTAALREAPATVPALAALALFVVWATSQAGYPVTHWAPGALIVLVLLAIALGLVRLRAADVPPAVRVAVGALAVYTAFSFLSILWAAVPGDAWEGADRTLLYLLVFALFACWRQTGVSAGLLLGAWTLALIALAAFVALHVDSATAARLQAMLPGGRLIYPTGYANANAAQWLMAFWPAVLLARGERLPWGLRGLLAGGAVLLAEVALLSQSRGSLYATPVMIVLVFALLPGRTRTFAVLVPIAAGIAAAAPAVLHVGDHLSHEAVTPSAVHSATVAMFAAALAVGLVVALGAALEGRLTLSQRSAGRVRTGVRAVAVATLVAVLAGGVVAAGNPIARIETGWHTFKGGYAADSTGGSRLISGLGSNRYDFYRVALDEFLHHPLLGIGADNFQQQYLAHGRSAETPHYPHSVELRTLTDTGLLGALLALVGLAAALLAGARALRRSDPLASTVAAAALAGFGYWVVHGSFDWFWEFAGLGAPAFAMLGLACALAPRAHSARPRRAIGRRLGIAAAVLVALAAAASLVAPWLSQLEIESAARIWTRAPSTAYARLEDAARLNPLSDEADSVAGSIALRYGELARADRDFALALERDPGDAYAALERGAIASARGERTAALGLLERAQRLAPREPLARQALGRVRAGGRVDLDELNRAILLKAEQLA